MSLTAIPWQRRRATLGAPVGLIFVLFAGPAQSVTLDQVDDFETETAEGWVTGQAAVPVQASGGPDGVSDAYIEPVATGSGGPGQRLVVFNAGQWAGDYPTAGVTAISLDALHVSGADVSLRVALTGPAGSVASETAIVVSSGVWETLEFSIDPADLVFLSGIGDTALVLSEATHLRILHSAALPGTGLGGFPRGEPIAAAIGIDNVMALPEPSMWLQSLAVLVATTLFARRRRTRPR